MGTIKAVMIVLLSVWLALSPIMAIGDDQPVICKVSSFSNDKPLPFEPVGVLAILQNMTDEEQKIEDGDMGFLYLRVKYPDGTVEESASSPLGNPAKGFFISLTSKGSRESENILNYLERGTHAFAEPGINVSIGGRIARVESGFEASVDVQSLSGRDRAAYDFLKTTELPKGFYWSSGNMPDLPDNAENLAAMRKFADDYRETKYAGFARLGVGLLYWRMSADKDYDAATKSWLPVANAEKNRKRSIHAFKQLIREWKEAKGEKDDGDEDGEEERDNEKKKAAVEKHVMFWASTYLGQIYEDWGFETLETGTITHDRVNRRGEIYRNALKVYEYALTQETNEYWKFVFQPLVERVKKKIAQNEALKNDMRDE